MNFPFPIAAISLARGRLSGAQEGTRGRTGTALYKVALPSYKAGEHATNTAKNKAAQAFSRVLLQLAQKGAVAILGLRSPNSPAEGYTSESGGIIGSLLAREGLGAAPKIKEKDNWFTLTGCHGRALIISITVEHFTYGERRGKVVLFSRAALPSEKTQIS